MKSRFLTPAHISSGTPDIYADKSALVLQWLLLVGIERRDFSLREVAADSRVGVSLGLVQRIFDYLVREGYIETVGFRTTKKFKLKTPSKLLTAWTKHYSLTNKCKIANYQTTLGSREEVLDALKRSNLWKKTCLALHSAAELHGCKNTNLQTIELYILDPSLRSQLEKKLQLQPQERGYDVLLITPYYKSVLNDRKQGTKLLPSAKLQASPSHFFYSPSLLTYLDLFHFPLRGREQADFMAQKIPELRRIIRK
ncbi:hypothetical protein EBR03_07690 [bacterium]|nr:hypothetical protein [bacterium]